MVKLQQPVRRQTAIAEGPGDSTPPGKSGVPSSTGAPPAPVKDSIPVDDKGPAPMAAPLPKSDAPASQALSVPENQTADANPGLSDLEFAEYKLIFENLQKTAKTRGADAKSVYREAAKAIWQKMVGPKVSATQRQEFNKIPKI